MFFGDRGDAAKRTGHANDDFAAGNQFREVGKGTGLTAEFFATPFFFGFAA